LIESVTKTIFDTKVGGKKRRIRLETQIFFREKKSMDFSNFDKIAGNDRIRLVYSSKSQGLANRSPIYMLEINFVCRAYQNLPKKMLEVQK